MIRPKAKILVVCLLLGLTFASVSYAALVNCGRASQLPANFNSLSQVEKTAALKANQCKPSDLIFLIERIINFLLAWAWLVAIFYVMWAGYNMITAGGNSEAIDSAKTTFRNAIIGFFLIMGAYLLINWLVGLLVGVSDSRPEQGAFGIIRNLLP